VNPPAAVHERTEREPSPRAQNTRFGITPDAVVGFDYYASFSQVMGAFARWFSVWAFPWWASEAAPALTGYGRGAYGSGNYGEG
jgi:hypothetical protein